ncbi:MAG: AbrB/MazE/SpoVT family DNA-binding domain-containing protein [Balneolaceae bacterium]|nr:AbrB/MazE/SpoVT family DNA-binding domain-containing protein [Balneolaceae bacterium]
MEAVKVSPKFQISIPAKIMKSLNIKAGQKVLMIPIDGRIEMVPIKDAKSLRGIAKGIELNIEKEADRL